MIREVEVPVVYELPIEVVKEITTENTVIREIPVELIIEVPTIREVPVELIIEK